MEKTMVRIKTWQELYEHIYKEKMPMIGNARKEEMIRNLFGACENGEILNIGLTFTGKADNDNVKIVKG